MEKFGIALTSSPSVKVEKILNAAEERVEEFDKMLRWKKTKEATKAKEAHELLMEKGAETIISMFEKESIPVVLCCGKIDNEVSEKLSMNVFPIELSRYYDSVQESIENFEESIKFACDEIAGMTDILTKIY